MDGDVMKNYGGLDFWVIRLDKDGNLVWERNYGGTYNDVAHVIIEGDEPGTFLVVGSTDSPDHDIPVYRGKTDVLVIKIDTLGRKMWSETYGGSLFEEPYSVVKASDGTFWISGTTFSNDDQIRNPKGKGDLWLFRINGKGELLESYNFGGSWDEGGNRVRLTPDGKNILLAGTTRSSDGDVRRKSKGLYEGWLLRLDSTVSPIWEYSIGGYQNEMFFDMILMTSGDYLAVGYTASSDGDLLYCGGHGGNDGWIVAVRDPATPSDLISKTPTAIVGYIYDAETKELILDTEVQLVDLNSNRVVASAKPHPHFHYYTFFVPDTQEVILGVSKKGYLFVSERVEIPPDQKYTEIRRDFYLKPIKPGERLPLYNIYFDPGKWDIKPESYPELDRLARFLLDNPKVFVEISGHTDNTGDPGTKKELSLRRANAVKYYLVRKGVEESRLTTKGYGPDRPVASNDTEEGRRLNRRVEFEIIQIVK
jgi:outer membrane protein OmpA-like peptidoglycan-associated protein